MAQSNGSSRQRDKNELGQVWNFKGKYADYMRDLCGDHENFKVIFDQIYHGYAFCALYGLLKGRRQAYDPSKDDPNDSPNLGFRWAYADSSGLYAYDNLRKFVLLYSKAGNTSFDAKIDSALRFDYTTNDVQDPKLLEKSQYKQNSDIIDEYVLGGLELLHEKVERITSPEAMITFMNETLSELQDVVESKKAERRVKMSE